MPEKKPIIISVGGSLISQENINIEFIRKLSLTLKDLIDQGERFILVAGGGKTCRKYQEAVRELGGSQYDEDWVGIYATKLNASLLRQALKEYACKETYNNPEIKIDWAESVLVGAGYEPGHSTDHDAVLLAKTYGCNKIINLTVVDYAYNKDPRTNPDAIKFEDVSWQEFLKIIPTEWTPGLNSPFDPKASRTAAELKLHVAIINGEHLDRMKDFILDKDFIGTHIH